MTVTRKALVDLFIVLEALVALGMLVISVHGPNGLPHAAWIYLIVAASLTAWAGWRLANTLAFAGIGLALLALAPGIVVMLEQVEEKANARRIAATRVTDVKDDVILSASGRPIGVRVSFNVTVPKRGYFAITPWLHSRDPRGERLDLFPARRTIDGSSDEKPFEARRTHAVSVELYPTILVFRRTDRCLQMTDLVPPLSDSVSRAPLRVMISDTPYGNVYNGGTERLTQGAYDLGELYRGVLAEGLQPCT